MKILYYEGNEPINPGKLLDSLIQLGLKSESLFSRLSILPFFKENDFNLERIAEAVGFEAGAPPSDFESIPFKSIQHALQSEAPNGKFAAQLGKVINLLIQSSEMVAQSSPDKFVAPTGIPENPLLALLAYLYGLDILNIGAVFIPALPLISKGNPESKLIDATYKICQNKVLPATSLEKSIDWVAAAMLATLAEFHVPPFRFIQTVADQRESDSSSLHPLRAFLGELEIAEDKEVVLIQTNLDDLSPQLLTYAIDRLFEAGALDVYQIPIYMKKNRLGIQLNVTVRKRDEAKLANIILKETTTLGVNVRALDHRYHAEIRMITVGTKYGMIPVKQKYLKGILIQSKPEYEVTAKIASELQVSMAVVLNEVADQLKLKDQAVETPTY